MDYGNNTMEIIALTTAMAEARAAIQAASREIRNYQRREGGSQVDDMLEACDSILAVIQTHLAYIARRDSLLVVPGTNAGNSGQMKFICTWLTFVELRVSDYWTIAKIFEELHDKVQTSPNDVQWQDIAQNIQDSSTSIQSKFANTLAAFGVEVCICFPCYSSSGLVLVCHEYHFDRQGQGRSQRRSQRFVRLCSDIHFGVTTRARNCKDTGFGEVGGDEGLRNIL